MSNPTPTGQPTPPSHPDTVIERYKRRTAIIGAVAAALAVATGVLSFTTATANQSANKAQQSNQTLVVEVSSVRESAQSVVQAKTSDQAELSAAQAQVSQQSVALSSLAGVISSQAALISQSSPVPTVTETVTTTVDPSTVLGPVGTTLNASAPTPRHSDSDVILADQSLIDLDAAQSDKLWSSGDGSSDLKYDGTNHNVSSYAGAMLVLGTTKATYNSCDHSGYSNNTILDLTSAPIGSYFCIKTSSNRLSAVRLLQATPKMATFSIVTYDPPLTS